MNYHMSKFEANARFNQFSVILFSVLFIIKVLIVLFILPYLSDLFPHLYNFGHFPDGYDQIASNVIKGGGYRFYPETTETMMRGPGYTFLLGGIFFLFGKSLMAVKVINVIFSIWIAYIIIIIGRKCLNNTINFWLSASIFLFHPGTILAESRGGVEIFLTRHTHPTSLEHS